jgi:glutaredoxin 3
MQPDLQLHLILKDKNMAEITIYSSNRCPFCDRAKELLTKKGVDYAEVRVDLDQTEFENMLSKSNGRRTVPQIFINDTHVGGFDDLWQLEQDGKLDAMLTNN